MVDYSVYKRTDHSSLYQMKIPVFDADGKVVDQKRMSTGTASHKLAKEIAQAATLKARQEGQLGVRQNPYLLEVIDAAIKARERNNQKGTADGYKTFKRVVTELLGKRAKSTTVRTLDRMFIETMSEKFADRPNKHGRQHSQSHVKNFVTFLIMVYNFAADKKYAVPAFENFKGLKPSVPVKTRHLMSQVPRTLKDGSIGYFDEEDLLFEQLDPTRHVANAPPYEERVKKGHRLQRQLQDTHDLVVLLIDTGVRGGEGYEAPWAAIDTRDWSCFNFYAAKVGKEGNFPLTERLKEVLKRRHRETNSPYIFAHRDNPMKPRGYAPNAIKRAIARAGLNEEHLVERYGSFTPMHSFRHTFASRLVQNGMSLYSVSRLLGHTDTKTTERYAHLAPSQVGLEAVEILNKLKVKPESAVA